MAEPGTFSDNNTQTQSVSKSAKDNLATVLTIGIIIGFLIIVFAVTWIIIDIIPIPAKWLWLLNDATIGNWILLIGVGLLEFFFALTASIYIWKKGRNYLLERI